jgi:hypothetical protein
LPVPELPDRMVMKPSLLVAVHGQPAEVATVTVDVPAAAGKYLNPSPEAGFVKAKLHWALAVAADRKIRKAQHANIPTWLRHRGTALSDLPPWSFEKLARTAARCVSLRLFM